MKLITLHKTLAIDCSKNRFKKIPLNFNIGINRIMILDRSSNLKKKKSSYQRIRTQNVQDAERTFYVLSYRGQRL